MSQADEPLPHGVSRDAVAKICADAECVGPFARIEVFHDADGQVARLYFHGDLERCSHPPSQYYGPDGTPGDVVPLVPIVPGSEEAAAFAALHARNTEGLVKVGSLSGPCAAPE